MVSGGKYWLPSTSMVASLSARLTSFQIAFMSPRTLLVQYFIPNGPGPDRPLRCQLAARIRGRRGRHQAGPGPLALRIDHIGSTAVPRLAAKDVIDVQVSVAALDPEAALVEPLRA